MPKPYSGPAKEGACRRKVRSPGHVALDWGLAPVVVVGISIRWSVFRVGIAVADGDSGDGRCPYGNRASGPHGAELLARCLITSTFPDLDGTKGPPTAGVCSKRHRFGSCNSSQCPMPEPLRPQSRRTKCAATTRITTKRFESELSGAPRDVVLELHRRDEECGAAASAASRLTSDRGSPCESGPTPRCGCLHQARRGGDRSSAPRCSNTAPPRPEYARARSSRGDLDRRQELDYPEGLDEADAASWVR